MSNKQVKLGIMGCGDIARKHYIPGITGAEDQKAIVTAVCDPVEPRAKDALQQANAKEYFLDVDEMLEKADVDAVLVLTTIKTHAALSIKAAQAGKHILTQKAMASTMEDAHALVNAVRSAGVKCVVEPASILSPPIQKSKEILEEKTLGKVCLAYASSSHGGSRHQSWQYTDPTQGGSILNMGVYAISALTAALGPAKAVIGFATVSVDRRPVKQRLEKAGEQDVEPVLVRNVAYDNTITIMDYGGGTVAYAVSNICTRGAVLPFPGPRCEFYCEKGAVSVHENVVVLNSRWIDQPSGFFIVSEEKPALPAFFSGKQFTLEKAKAWGHDGWFIKEPTASREISRTRPRSSTGIPSVNHLVDCILDDKDPLPNVEWGRHVTEIMLKSYQSSEMGTALKLSTTF